MGCCCRGPRVAPAPTVECAAVCSGGIGPAEWAVTAVVSTDTCSDDECVDFHDGTYNAEYVNNCIWNYSPYIDTPCNGTPGNYSIVTITLTYSASRPAGTEYRIDASLKGTTPWPVQYQKASGSAFDCLTGHTLDLVTDNGNSRCHWPSTIYIEPA